jgi:hypothetical protein
VAYLLQISREDNRKITDSGGDMFTEANRINELRSEQREKRGYPRVFAGLRRLDGDTDGNGGLIADISSSGVSFITRNPYPIGTKIKIDIDNKFSATGEVVDLQEAWGEWDWNGMVRMNVRLIEKEKWPF